MKLNLYFFLNTQIFDNILNLQLSKLKFANDRLNPYSKGHFMKAVFYIFAFTFNLLPNLTEIFAQGWNYFTYDWDFLFNKINFSRKRWFHISFFVITLSFPKNLWPFLNCYFKIAPEIELIQCRISFGGYSLPNWFLFIVSWSLTNYTWFFFVNRFRGLYQTIWWWNL